MLPIEYQYLYDDYLYSLWVIMYEFKYPMEYVFSLTYPEVMFLLAGLNRYYSEQEQAIKRNIRRG